MRRIVAVAVLVTLAVGCAPVGVSSEPESFAERQQIAVGVVHVRGCDYVVARVGYGVAIVHAGDCGNLIGHSTRNGLK